jgi:N-methylhydantoinase B
MSTVSETIQGIDPITFEVLKNAFLNATEEMAMTIRRAAYSTNIKTRGDFSCAFFDADLRCIVQSFAQPGHLTSMKHVVPTSVREYGVTKLHPGDALLVNDPHRGASHLNDVCCIAPVFVGERCIGYLANIAHHVDVGGSTPASLGLSREIFQEGIILPPIKIVSRGELNDDMLGLILENVRAPRETRGDLRAQIAANQVGARRVAELVSRYSPETAQIFCDELLDYTERWTRKEFLALPQGVYRADGYRDDDGFSDEPIYLQVEVEIRDGRVSVDVSGSSPQRAAPINSTRSFTSCALAFVAKCLIDQQIVVNEGFYRLIDVKGPDGLIVTAVRPAAVVGGWEVSSRVAELIFLALYPVLPDRVPAAGKGIMCNLGFAGHHPARGEFYVYMETVAGGNGARPTKDGADAVQTNLHNTENAPIEEVELNYPIQIARYELVQDSGGPGRFRGGLGVRRDFAFPYTDCIFTVMSDGRKFAPWGLDGGLAGRPAHFILDPEGEARELPSKITLTVPKGGRVSVQTPGGGGHGAPAERDAQHLADDLRTEKYSTQFVKHHFGR